MDGTDEVAKKKSKKGKDKDSSKLEKALKVSPRLCDRRPPADPAHRDQCTLITEREVCCFHEPCAHRPSGLPLCALPWGVVIRMLVLRAQHWE